MHGTSIPPPNVYFPSAASRGCPDTQPKLKARGVGASMELQEDSKHKRRSFSKGFKLKVVKYYHDNIKNNNKTATYFHVNRIQVSAFLSYTIFFISNSIFHFSLELLRKN